MILFFFSHNPNPNPVKGNGWDTLNLDRIVSYLILSMAIPINCFFFFFFFLYFAVYILVYVHFLVRNKTDPICGIYL